MTESSGTLARELAIFLVAVLFGSVCGLAAQVALLPILGGSAATNVALAVATTGTGATHAHLVHGQPFRTLAPRILVAAPLAYGVMRGLHALIGQ